jgi:hypothetical protein
MLRLLSNYGHPTHLVLDEWKVLVDAADLPQVSARNIADPMLGGQVVSMIIPDRGFGIPDLLDRESILTEDPRPWSLRCDEECADLSWTIGFNQLRAAQINRIEWADVPELNPANQWRTVEVYASLETPLGPWQPIGQIPLAGQPMGEHALDLSAPTWARYVRFVMPAPAEPYTNHYLPAVIRIFERASGEEYQTILGEWGWENKSASFERVNPPDYAPITEDDDNDTPAAAEPLAGPVSGYVTIEQDEDWYEFTAPEEQNTVEFLLRGQPSSGAALALQTESGEPVALVRDEEASSPAAQVWRATVAPGDSYRLRVYEPPRSIMFVWDTSGSVEPFRPIIYQALGRFVEGVTRDQEEINLWPFDAGTLLEEWQSDPTLILEGLQNYVESQDSSETAKELLGAVQQLGARDGSRAAIVIGDFDFSTDVPVALWQTLAFAQPHIYAMRVSHILGGGEFADWKMEQWAAINNGDARYAPTISELELGFDRAATRLRQPANYNLDFAFTFTPPPGPGQLRLVSQIGEQGEDGPPPTLGNTAVEIILDASGSMLQTLGGQRRIDIAKETLLNLTGNVLAPGTPVALRVFGHIEGNYSCRTDLEIPLQPLDPTAMQTRISNVEPKNLANTPLAASLALVGQDLAEAEGQKVVILVTDGEETCDGDPAAAIEALRAQGFDVRVNIVGFAIGDAALKAQFEEWAVLGGGEYFDAADESQLNTALQQALRVPFRVLNADGEEVAAGFVNGEPLQLPAGIYTVDVLAEPIVRYENVVITGDEEAVILVEADH